MAQRSVLLPDRHEPDFFVCDIFDAPLKSESASMTHPMFTLATNPDMTPRNYKRGDTNIKISPSAKGLATIHDRDVIIYAVSQLMAAKNAGMEISKTIRFHARDLLITTNRRTCKNGYSLLRDAFKRLQGTQIETNIKTGGKTQWDVFSYIDKAQIIREDSSGRMLHVELTLSDWIFNAIDRGSTEVLTISKDYFRLRKPLERKLYDIARKCCGRNSYWHIKLETLYQMTGSTAKLKEFRRMVKAIVAVDQEHGHIPDYSLELEGDLLKIRPRASFTNTFKQSGSDITLPLNAHDKARPHAGGWDIYMLEEEWRAMIKAKDSKPKNSIGSFIGYVKWYVTTNGSAR